MNTQTRPISGDVVLCRARSKPKANLIAQAFVRPFSLPKFSHVAVVAAEGYLIHATPDLGVHFTSMHQFFLAGEYELHWVVYRHRAFAEQLKADYWNESRRVGDACDFHLFQSYSYYFNLPTTVIPKRDRDRSFCSQLAVRIYEMLNIQTGISKNQNSLVLPIDFQSVTSDENLWVNVTEYYVKHLELGGSDVAFCDAFIESEIRAHEIATKQAQLELKVSARLEGIIKFSNSVEDALNHIAGSINHLADAINLPEHKIPAALIPVEPALDTLRTTSTRHWQSLRQFNNLEKTQKRRYRSGKK